MKADSYAHSRRVCDYEWLGMTKIVSFPERKKATKSWPWVSICTLELGGVFVERNAHPPDLHSWVDTKRVVRDSGTIENRRANVEDVNSGYIRGRVVDLPQAVGPGCRVAGIGGRRGPGWRTRRGRNGSVDRNNRERIPVCRPERRLQAAVWSPT